MEEWNPNIFALNNGNLVQDSLINNETDINMIYEDNLMHNSKRLADAEHFKTLVSKSPPGSLALCAILEFTRPENRPSNSRFREVYLIVLVYFTLLFKK